MIVRTSRERIDVVRIPSLILLLVDGTQGCPHHKWESPVLRELENAGKLESTGAMYELGSAAVEFVYRLANKFNPKFKANRE